MNITDKKTAQELIDGVGGLCSADDLDKIFKDISEYTKQDFIDGTEPYEYCCLFRSDQFAFEQQKNKVNDIAKQVGIKNFPTLLNLYCKKHGVDVEIANFTNFPDQPLTLCCGNYVCDFAGIRSDDDMIVCPHPIMPVERLCNIDTGIEKMKIAFSRGKGWRTIVVDRRTIASAQKIVELTDNGIAVTSESAKALVKYFAKMEQLNSNDLLTQKDCVTRLGWIERGDELNFSPYVEDVTFDGEAEYRKHYDAVKLSGDFEKWYRFINTNIRKNNVTARIVFAASLASILVKPLGCNCFWIHLWGETECAKTVLAMVAGSIWGNPEIGAYLMTFNSTVVGMEKTAAFYNNLPYILDELQIINDKKDLDNLIYMLTEGSGRSRGNKNGGLEAVPKWKNVTITTGERPIITAGSQGGAVNRVLEIECKQMFFKEPREAANLVKSNYGFLGKLIAGELAKNGFDAVERSFAAFQRELIEKYGIMQKQAQAAALILAADELIGGVFHEEDNLTPAEIAEFLKTKDDVSANPRGYEYVCEYIAESQNKFIADPDRPGELWGKLTDNSVYIIKKRFVQICEEGGYNSQSLLSWLKDKQLIEIKSGKNTVMQRIGGVNTRCVHLSLSEPDDEKRTPKF